MTVKCSNGSVMSVPINGLIENRTFKLSVPVTERDSTQIEREAKKIARLREQERRQKDAACILLRFLRFVAAKTAVHFRRRKRVHSCVDA